MTPGIHCRECDVELTDENTGKNRGHICRPCYNQREKLRGRRVRNRTKALSGRVCGGEGCSESIHKGNRSGLCRPCLLKDVIRRRKEGQVPSRAMEIVEEHLCKRCGIKTTREICRDCWSVARTLGELEVWVTAA